MPANTGARQGLPALIATLALLAGLLTAALAGCDFGGDTKTVTVTVTTQTTKTGKDKRGADQGVDSEGNDIAPPPGSPAAKFEQYCRDHPAACD
jgi:hypothetical protein